MNNFLVDLRSLSISTIRNSQIQTWLYTGHNWRFVIFIRALRSELNLKPYFRAQSKKVGAVGCTLGIPHAYFLMYEQSRLFGIEDNVPIRQYDVTIQLAFLRVV